MTARPQLSTRKKLLWGLFCTVALFAALELLLALLGYRPAYREDDPFVGFDGASAVFERQGGSMVTAETKLEWFNSQRFAAARPSGSYRIFCLGGSTTYGRPYDDRTSFCGWLRELLPIADPRRDWEVINAGGISYASYRVARVMDELTEHRPDLFLVYSGHNEFLERRTYQGLIETARPITWLTALAGRTRTYGALREVVGKASATGQAERADPFMLPGEVRAVLDTWVGPEAYSRDEALRDQILDHYRFNLERMAGMARQADAELLLVTPASNLRDCSPFRGQFAAETPPEQRARWEASLSRAIEAERRGQLDAALAELSLAEQIDRRHADLHYVKGRLLWSVGRHAEAREAFLLARDEDVCPLRALGVMPGIVREVAAEQGTMLVDFESRIENLSSHGVSDGELFVDHVHPTIGGNRVLALAIIETMIARGIVRPATSWNASAVEQVTRRVEGGIDPEAHAIALRNLAKVLGWAGKTGEAERLALRTLQALPDDFEALFLAGYGAEERGDVDRALGLYRRAVEANPDYPRARLNLGNMLLNKGQLDQAAEQYRAAIRIDPEYADAYHNLGTVHVDRGQLQEAIRLHERALELDADLVAASTELAVIHVKLGDLPSAIDQISRAMPQGTSSADLNFQLGMLLFGRGEKQLALERFQQVVALAPGDAEAHNNLGAVLLELGQPERAREWFMRALELDPGHPEARRNLTLIRP